MAENIINKVLKDERPFYQQAFENSIDALPDDLSTGHGKAMYTPNGIVDRAQSVGDYHKMANADLSNRISNKIGENYGNLAQAGYNLFSPALSMPASFGYDYSQAKDRMEPDSGIMGLGKAFMDESPFSAAYQRAVGVADPFFQQFGMTTVPENALKNNLRPANINFTNLLQQDVNKDIYNGYKSEQPADAISRTNVQGMDLEMDPAAQEGFLNPNIQPSQNMFQRAGNAIQGGLGSIRDFAVDKGMSARNLLGSGAAMAMGLPGIVGSGAMSLLGGLGNMFEDRQLSGDGTIVDEYGRSYNASDLNKQNALGGYYTDPARSSRRRTARIANMQRREAEGKRISAKNLAKLQAQEALQEQARQEVARQMQDSNRAARTGGYQAGYSSDFMEGPAPGASNQDLTSTMGSFRDGGLATMFVRRR
jgi:hypothetical protein